MNLVQVFHKLERLVATKKLKFDSKMKNFIFRFKSLISYVENGEKFIW